MWLYIGIDEGLAIPTVLWQFMRTKLCSEHQGIYKCKQRQCESMWWLGIGKNITHSVDNCTVCLIHRQQATEPLITHLYPSTNIHAPQIFSLKGEAIYFLDSLRLQGFLRMTHHQRKL